MKPIIYFLCYLTLASGSAIGHHQTQMKGPNAKNNKITEDVTYTQVVSKRISGILKGPTAKNNRISPISRRQAVNTDGPTTIARETGPRAKNNR